LSRSGGAARRLFPVDGLAVVLGQAAPHPVGLADGQGVLTALLDHRALLADRHRPVVPTAARRTALALGVEEGVRVGGAAEALVLPLPERGNRDGAFRHVTLLRGL